MKPDGSCKRLWTAKPERNYAWQFTLRSYIHVQKQGVASFLKIDIQNIEEEDMFNPTGTEKLLYRQCNIFNNLQVDLGRIQRAKKNP